ncbi:MAG: hypothetical protein M1817_006634 [Caeruleum heppii]|nr:MAG: hypothetical protein M1817_006634 [Caeruleum heppii]
MPSNQSADSLSRLQRLLWRLRKGFPCFSSTTPEAPSSLPVSYPPPPPPARYPHWPPPPPQQLLDEREDYEKALCEQARYRMPKGEHEDQPLYALYRIYEHLILYDIVGIRNNVERFWNRHQWAVKDIPDPHDEDSPARYAVLACISHLLVEAFNNNIGQGMPRDAPAIITYDELDELNAREKVFEEVPSWTHQVPRLEETLWIPHEGNQYLRGDDNVQASPPFREKNIIIKHPFVLFI